MPAKALFTVEQVAEALQKSGGVPAAAAKLLKCDWHTVMRYLSKYPELEALRVDAREQKLDLAEDQLIKAMEKGEPWAVKFFLLTQGKDRGYSERREMTGANGTPLGRPGQVVVIQVPDNGRREIEGPSGPVIDVPHQVIEDKRRAG